MKKIHCLLLGLALLPFGAEAEESPWWQFWRNRTAQQESGAVPGDQTQVRQPLNLLFSEAEKDRLRAYLRGVRHGQSSDIDDDKAYASDDDRDDKKGKGKDKGKGKGKDKQKPLPPGLQKKVQRGGELPPGWQRKVARGEVIDGELYSQSQPLPSAVQADVDDPAGTETRRIGDRVFRVMRRTREVLDVLNAQ